MAKGPNVIVKGKAGTFVVIDCDGNIECVGKEKLGGRIATLMAKRQAAGIAISKALLASGFNVCSQQESFVLDSCPPDKNSAKKAAKKSAKKAGKKK